MSSDDGGGGGVMNFRPGQGAGQGEDPAELRHVPVAEALDRVVQPAVAVVTEHLDDGVHRELAEPVHVLGQEGRVGGSRPELAGAASRAAPAGRPARA